MTKETVATNAKSREVSKRVTYQQLKEDNKETNHVFMLLIYMIVMVTVVFFCFIVLMNITATGNNRSENVPIMVRINEFVYNNNKNTKTNEEAEAKVSGTRVLVYDGKQKYVTWPDPPSKKEYPSVARYVMHISEFGSLATNSTHKGIKGYPFVNVFSVSDGPFNKSSGIPYFYLTPLELSVIDIKANNKASLTVTEAQSDYCSKKGFDPEDPRCAHAIFTGIIVKVEDPEEQKFAKNALFSRHVEMSSWPSGHNWFFAKMEIQHIYLLDFFGGAKVVNVEDYFKADPFPKKN